MTVKAQLRVQLFADAVLVAESDDQQLWQNVFAAIQAGKAALRASDDLKGAAHAPRPSTLAASNGPTADFAVELGISDDELVGACRPETEQPYIHLDQRYWEALRTKTGSRGIDSIAPVSLAATLLGIWFKHARIDTGPTVQQCQEVLATIGLRDQNAARSLRNAEWLQSRNGAVRINPARWSQAVRIAKAYCLMKAPKELQAGSSERPE